MTPPIKVLLYGKDARSDALAEGLTGQSDCTLDICAPFRSPGLVARAAAYHLAPMTDLGAMVAVARESQPDLVVVGPEDALAAGLGGAVRALGIPCFGPSAPVARIETSKSFARQLVADLGLGVNPGHRAFSDGEGLEEYIALLTSVVVKPDGLTGGKGVKIQGEQLAGAGEALAYALSLIEADGSVVIEERLEGEELSLQTITDGESVLHCPAVQDHKRAHEGDTGPNTGGMGSYSCPDGSLPFLDAEDLRAAEATNEAVIEGLGRLTGEPYRGVLYGGFMATRDGVRLVEYNARFGDPEAMNVLPLFAGDLAELLLAAASGDLGRITGGGRLFESRATVCKYVVPLRYPDTSEGAAAVSCDDSVLGPELRRYWAATELGEDGAVRLTGSRGLAFVGIGETLAAAEALAEAGARSVSGDVRHRSDIGTKQAIARRVAHMVSVRTGAPGH